MAVAMVDLKRGQSVELVERSAGHYQISGALTFVTARHARELGLAALSSAGGGQIEIDCNTITASDSAGLAVLLDWLAYAKRSSRSLRFVGLPNQVKALAQISDVLPLLEKGV
jgi:phospholipid transport system transporter-binding protein